MKVAVKLNEDGHISGVFSTKPLDVYIIDGSDVLKADVNVLPVVPSDDFWSNVIVEGFNDTNVLDDLDELLMRHNINLHAHK